jgi:cell division transport system permease protein
MTYWITIKRIIKLGLVNFWRNRWLSLAASLMIMLTLVTMGVFALLNVFANSTAEGIKDRIDLSIYFYENATDKQVQDLQYKLTNRADVKAVKYISKEEALAIWQSRPINSKVKDLVTADENSLPRSLQIKATTPEALAGIATELSTDEYKPYVRKISYEETKTAIDKIISITQFIQKLGLVITCFLLVISLVVIMNTIRLTIFTRRDEIEIMRLVGANGSFIRVPFGVEAILYGILGSLLAYMVIALIMTNFGPRMSGYFADVATTTATPYFYLIRPYFYPELAAKMNVFMSLFTLWPLFIVQLAIGILFSVSCSLLALRRYLKL